MSNNETVQLTREDRERIEALVADIGRTPDKLIPLLQGIQAHFRYLPREALTCLCDISDLAPSQVEGVSTFYSQFRHRPAGRHSVKICVGTACHVKGADRVYDALHRHLGCKENEDTDADRVFTLEKVACLGCCTLAPAVQIDEVIYGHVTATSAPEILADFLQRARSGRLTGETSMETTASRGEVRVGFSSCCMAEGSAEVALAAGRAAADLGPGIAVKPVGCIGMCRHDPLIEVVVKGKEPVLYAKVNPRDIPRILSRHFPPSGIGKRLSAWINVRAEQLLTAESDNSLVARYQVSRRDGPVKSFLEKQKHIASEFCGEMDPLDLQEYRDRGGFEALRRALTELSAEQIMERIESAGLRGRGGAGFPTATKWKRVRESAGGTVYIVCNGDEGDPGAFMDRMLLESYPYRIIEGMAVAARAVGAAEGILYIRAEYPLAVSRVREALAKCRENGLLGEHILGTGFSLNLRIMEGAGAFVCGEETALLKSIEGRRGMPCFRPPFPSDKGLWGAPTLVNNCETFACVPWIIRHGSSAFAAIGTSRSTGTKVFSLAGKIRFGGLVEVPMGMTIRQIVEEVGGGVADDKRFKAVQIGGPSGGCIPERLADLPVDYEALTGAGAMMGSGGLVVLDEDDCMVDIARYFLGFTREQSCGRCTFCRVGTRRMLDILERVCDGCGTPGDIEKLEELAHRVADASLCGLGKSAPNPVLTTLKYFREEYEAHLAGTCPAGKCTSLIRYTIDESCNGCTICSQSCPVEAIPFAPHTVHTIDDTKCICCDTCRTSCPVDAVKIEPKVSEPDRKTRSAQVKEEGTSGPAYKGGTRT